MKLRRIALDGFRNYTDFTADFSPGVNVIWGENAQGKTNLLEAIGFLSGARSHRARGDKELISFHRDKGTITAEVTSRGREFLLEAQLTFSFIQSPPRCVSTVPVPAPSKWPMCCRYRSG